MKTYTATQIETAKMHYNNMLVIRTVESYEPQYIGWSAAEQRCEAHNNIVTAILNGNKEVAKEWKTFFLNEAAKLDRKLAESKAKLELNKANSADVLAQIKSLRKLVEFGKWLNTSGNVFRKEHFSKKYTNESVSSFLSTIQ